MVYATYHDLENRLGFTLEPDEQSLVTQLIAEAESHIDYYTGKNFNNNPNELDVFDGAAEISQWTVRFKPLNVVNSVTLNNNVLTVGEDYAVYTNSSTIKFISALNADDLQNVEIDYDWGYATVPSAIKNICLEMVQMSFSQYLAFKNLKGADKITIGDITTQFTKQVMLTPAIERMLNPFRSISLRVI